MLSGVKSSSGVWMGSVDVASVVVLADTAVRDLYDGVVVGVVVVDEVHAWDDQTTQAAPNTHTKATLGVLRIVRFTLDPRSKREREKERI